MIRETVENYDLFVLGFFFPPLAKTTSDKTPINKKGEGQDVKFLPGSGYFDLIPTLSR